MNCPRCHSHRGQVTDSREDDVNHTIRRRRRCPSCGHRWTTYEVTAEDQAMLLERDRRVRTAVDALMPLVNGHLPNPN